jgi:ATP-dependent Clp protease ATP-binding subunit ClpB
MQFDCLTIKAQEAIQSAQRIAHQHSHQEVDGEHLLAALLAQTDSLTPSLLEKLGVSVEKVSADLERELSRRVKVGNQFVGRVSQFVVEENGRRCQQETRRAQRHGTKRRAIRAEFPRQVERKTATRRDLSG